jgi:hypothetical protein
MSSRVFERSKYTPSLELLPYMHGWQRNLEVVRPGSTMCKHEPTLSDETLTQNLRSRMLTSWLHESLPATESPMTAITSLSL